MGLQVVQECQTVADCVEVLQWASFVTEGPRLLLQLTMPVWKRTPGEENHTLAPSCLFPGSPLKTSWEPFVKPSPKLGVSLPLSSWKYLRQASINKVLNVINMNDGAWLSPFFESFEDFYTFFMPSCKIKVLYFNCKFSTGLWFCSGVYCRILDSELTRATNKCLTWIMKPAVSHLSCISVYFALILFCLPEEGGYFGWWGSSADPAAAVIQPRLCDSLELPKRDPNACGNCEVSFPTSLKVVPVG